MYMPRSTRTCKGHSQGGNSEMPIPKQTTPNPFTWRRFANVYMGDYILGEDIVDLASLGFCGETVTIFCPSCGDVLGNVPVELLSDGHEDPTTTHISYAVDWHIAKHHPRLD